MTQVIKHPFTDMLSIPFFESQVIKLKLEDSKILHTDFVSNNFTPNAQAIGYYTDYFNSGYSLHGEPSSPVYFGSDGMVLVGVEIVEAHINSGLDEIEVFACFSCNQQNLFRQHLNQVSLEACISAETGCSEFIASIFRESIKYVGMASLDNFSYTSVNGIATHLNINTDIKALGACLNDGSLRVRVIERMFESHNELARLGAFDAIPVGAIVESYLTILHYVNQDKDFGLPDLEYLDYTLADVFLNTMANLNNENHSTLITKEFGLIHLKKRVMALGNAHRNSKARTYKRNAIAFCVMAQYLQCIINKKDSFSLISCLTDYTDTGKLGKSALPKEF